ncbi:MAG TPA: DUF1963 domain-containing protein, partial [Myxococcota bacterium]|nr:DUF1963 domain-containing protein [Myxococcota bacterium]
VREPRQPDERQMPRHALATRGEGGLFLRDPDRMLGPPSYVQGQLDEIAVDEVLLLELLSNDAVGHRFGEGVYQFTIRPDDLAARRFDRARLTTSAY